MTHRFENRFVESIHPSKGNSSGILSVCIPTYNRSLPLERTLRSIGEHLTRNRLTDVVNVCVSDNHSSDITSAVVESLINEMHWLSYQRQSQNIGFQANALSAVAMARTPWIFVMGDDDEIVDNGLASLVSSIDENNGIVIFNSDTGDGHRNDFGLAGEPMQFQRVYDAIRFLGLFHFSYMGNMLFHRDAILREAREIDLRSIYPFTIAAFRIIEKMGCKLTDVPVLRGNHQNRDWMIWQPVFSSIDMARVLSQGPFRDSGSRVRPFPFYYLLLRSIPRAVFRYRCGRLPLSEGNPFRSLTFQNVAQCYSGSRLAQFASILLLGVSRIVPLWLLERTVAWLGQGKDPSFEVNGINTSLS